MGAAPPTCRGIPPAARGGTVGAVLGLLACLAASAPAARAAIDVSGTWHVCLECLSPCPLGSETATWSFAQSGAALHVDIPGFFPLDGMLDPGTGVFEASYGGGGCSAFCLHGVATDTAITATFETLVAYGVAGLRACDPLLPAPCDDGDAGTPDTCCHVPIGSCAAVLPSCTHADPPACVPPTTTTSTTTSTTLAGVPVNAVRLLLQRFPSGRERLVFQTKDPDTAFPPIGSADDPATGTPGGARIELFSRNEGRATLTVPAGLGQPGWTVTDAAADRYRFVGPGTAGSPSAVRVLLLQEGKGLRLVARAAGLPMTGPLDAVGIRITTGQRSTCALFDARTRLVDRAGKFLAKGAVAASLPDCADASLP